MACWSVGLGSWLCQTQTVRNPWKVTWSAAVSSDVLECFGCSCQFRSNWVCLKMGYTPNYSHLVGIMISKTIGCRGTQHFQTNPIDPSVSISIKISFQEEYDEALKEYKSSEGYKKYLGFMDRGNTQITSQISYASSMSSSGHVCSTVLGFGGLLSVVPRGFHRFEKRRAAIERKPKPKGRAKASEHSPKKSEEFRKNPKDSLWNGGISCGIEWNWRILDDLGWFGEYMLDVDNVGWCACYKFVVSSLCRHYTLWGKIKDQRQGPSKGKGQGAIINEKMLHAGYCHRIGWWENLQETPIFDGKNHGFP